MKCGWRSAVTLSAAMLCTPTGWAQSKVADAAQGAMVAGPGSTDGNALKDVKQSQENLFRTVNTPYSSDAKFGYGSGELRAGVPLGPGFGISAPLVQWGFRPDDAEIKLGNFYLDVQSLTGAVLYSDNANQSETNRKSGAIAMVQLKFAVMWQILENLRLAAGSSVTWLPFANKFGVSSPLAELSGQLSLSPQMMVQLTYDVPLGGWDILLYDQLTAQSGSYGLRRNQDFLAQDPSSIEDRIGRYSFREDLTRQGGDDRLLENRFNEVTEFRNEVGVSVSRVIPTETLLKLYASHSDSWYLGNSAGLPSSRDIVGISLESVRENMRFKPFFDYHITKTDLQKHWDHVVTAGVKGPVTDYLDFLGDVGYTYLGDTGREAMTWRIVFRHMPRPSTIQFLEYSRYITYPERDLGTTLSYRLYQTMGPYLTGGLGAERNTFEDLDNNNSASVEYRGQIFLDWEVGLRTNLRATLIYSDVNYENPAFTDHTLLTGRLQLNNRTTETITTSLTYQYEQRDSTLAGDSYYENLVLLSVTKSF
jgi:hypothetical protein